VSKISTFITTATRTACEICWLLYPPKIGRIADVVRSGRGSEFIA